MGGKVLFAGGLGICETCRVTTAEASAKEIWLIGKMAAASRPTKGTDQTPMTSDRSLVWGSVGGGEGGGLSLPLPLPPSSPLLLSSRGVLRNFRAARETSIFPLSFANWQSGFPKCVRTCRTSPTRPRSNLFVVNSTVIPSGKFSSSQLPRVPRQGQSC